MSRLEAMADVGLTNPGPADGRPARGLSVGQYLIRRLQDYGLKDIFGIPGDFALPLFDAIEASGLLPLYTLSHEPSVGFAADAAAREVSEIDAQLGRFGPRPGAAPAR